jgi:hypothetical protein
MLAAPEQKAERMTIHLRVAAAMALLALLAACASDRTSVQTRGYVRTEVGR